jgi:hypothetical protein
VSKKKKYIHNHTKNPEPSPSKIPRIAPTINPMDMRPSWRIGAIEMCDPFGWNTIDEKTVSYIRDKLKNFETMIWKQILLDASKQNHPVKVSDICKEARDRLEEIGEEDQQELISLRLGGIKRVWGIMDNGVLRLLWWDPNHKIYPSTLKHT